MATVFKAGRVPGRVGEFVMEGSSVAEALRTAGLTLATGEALQLDGEAVDADEFDEVEVDEGSTLLVAKQVKGN